MATYEMLWDCSSCGTPKLLGKTHRRCPHCGAPQDPTRRYFPPPGQEVPVEGHVYVGVDWSCGACSTPNSNAADFCVNCGNPKAGNQQVAKVVDTLSGVGISPSPSPSLSTSAARAPRRMSAGPPPPKVGKLPLVVGGLVLAVLVATLVTVFWQRDVQVRVEQHTWSREIDIEEMAAVNESAWCDSMPYDAYSVSRSREVRSHNQIPDGQDCRTVRSDNGDGTFSTSEQCTTRYRSEPVYDDKCYYTVNRWRRIDTRRAQGTGLSSPRVWPTVSVTGGSCMGCTRTGSRREALLAHLRGTHESTKTWQCDLDENRWVRLRDGDIRTIRVRVITGGAVCSTLQP